MSDDFDGFENDRPVSLGSIFGYRAFKIDRLGRLRSPAHEGFIFGPGENTAECNGYCKRAGTAGHGCGFYAWYTGPNSYAEHHGAPIRGVIEAWGLVSVGEKGFRAEKCKIVGLVAPKIHKPSTKRFCRLSRWVNRQDDKSSEFLGFLMIALTAMGSVATIILSFSALWPWLWISVPAAVISTAVTGLISHGHKHERYYKADKHGRTGRLQELYPDAQFFETERKMRKAFNIQPPSDEYFGELPTPETDDNFWKRKS